MAGVGGRFSIEAVISMMDHVTGPMRNANNSVGVFSANAKRHFGGVGSAARSALGFLGVAGGAGLIYVGMKKIVSEAANFENSVASFTTLLGGSGVEAKKLVGALQVLGAETPFEFKDLADATKRLLGFGVVTKDTAVPTLRMLGDLAQGSAEKLQGISLVYGQIMAGGKMMGQDFNQLINQGVPIAQGLAKVWGVDVNQAIARVKSSGGVAAKDVQAAMVQMTSKGGLFYGGMMRSSKTLTGLWSTFQDAISMTAGAIGAELMPTMKDVLISLTDVATQVLVWVQNNKDGIANIVDDIKSVIKFIWSMRYVVLAAAFAFMLYKIYVVAAAVATKGLVLASKGLKIFQTFRILGFVDGLKYYTIGTKAATAAQWLFNAAIKAFPLLMIAGLVAGGLAAINVAMENSGNIARGFFGIFTDQETANTIGSLQDKLVGLFKADVASGGYFNAFVENLKRNFAIAEFWIEKISIKIRRILPGADDAELDQRWNSFVGKWAGENKILAATMMSTVNTSSKPKSEENIPVRPPTMITNYASPQSLSMPSGLSYGNIDINVNAPKGAASVAQRGNLPAGTRLNKGAQ